MSRLFKRLTAMMLSAAIVLGTAPTALAAGSNCGGLEEVDVYYPEADDVIQDPILNWTIRSALNTITDHKKLTVADVSSGKVDYIFFESGAHPENFVDWKMPHSIQSLEGLQHATSATKIDIAFSAEDGKSGKGIKDLTPIAGLTKLRMLKLYDDAVTDISKLENLTNLEELYLDKNHITDISVVSNMKKLKKLTLRLNELENVDAVSGLARLEHLDLSCNRLTALPDMSAMTNVTFLDVSENDLDDAAIEEIGKMKGLQALTMSKNNRITDYRPLARLTELESENTFLPCDEATKTDLFAAVAVNRILENVNISRMTEDDLEDVAAALELYDALTVNQKTYFDSERIKAARSNAALVEQGEEPVYYEQYDEGGAARPVLNRIDIQVVDKHGKGIKGVTLVKHSITDTKHETDENGRVSFPHQGNDISGECSITVEAEGYVCNPTELNYELNSRGKTYTINGKRATGFEKHTFVLIPEEEYVDRTVLEQAIENYGTTELKRMYSEKTYRSYEEALEQAKTVLEDADATAESVADAASTLEKAYKGLKRVNILTTLRIHVKDKNGNPFARDFKLQVYTYKTKTGPWNIWAYEGNDYAELQASTGWKKGAKYEIACCNHEAFKFKKNIVVEVGVAEDGTRYFKKVNGKSVKSSYEINMVANPIAHAIDPDNEIRPSSEALLRHIEEAKQLKEERYTADSYEALLTVIESVSETAALENATQEEYNSANAKLKAAVDKLVERADNLALERAINQANALSESIYTRKSWGEFILSRNDAVAINDNSNSTQQEIDKAVVMLKEAEKKLVLKASSSDKIELQNSYKDFGNYFEENYDYGYEQLAEAVDAARAVYEDLEATREDVEVAIKGVNDAKAALVKAPDWYSTDLTFKGRVYNQRKKPLSGIRVVTRAENGSLIAETTTDSKGVFAFEAEGETYDKRFYVTVEDERYLEGDSHYYIQSKPRFTWSGPIAKIDGDDWYNVDRISYILEPVHKHNMTYHKAVARTCKKAGSSEYYSCSECGGYFSDEYGDAPVEKNSWIVPKGHNEVPIKAPVEATLWTTGKTAGIKCSACKKVLEKQKTIAKLAIASPSAAVSEGTLTAVFDPIEGATGYQIKYAYKLTKKGALSGAKTVKLAADANSCVIKKLKTGKTYYVQIRGVKKVGKKTYYTAWSEITKAM